MADDQKRPSEVFATRLRDTRKARELSQTELAQRMTERGRPMSKAALLRIENGERGLSLDEALAFAAVLFVAPAHLLSPRDEETVWLTDNMAVDGEGLRAWLLHGYEFIATTSDYHRAERAKALEKIVVAHAQALVDAIRGEDTAGEVAALKQLAETSLVYRSQLELIEQGAGLRIVTEGEPESVGTHRDGEEQS
jgi:transcriptional regulator with XRE-family HTH domain